MVKKFLFCLLVLGVLSVCCTSKAEGWDYRTDYVLAIEHARKVGYEYPFKLRTRYRYIIFWDFPSCPPIPKVCDWRYNGVIKILEKGPHHIVFLDNHNGQYRVCRRVYFLFEFKSISPVDLEVANLDFYSHSQRRKLK